MDKKNLSSIRLSLVLPVFNEEQVLEVLYEEIKKQVEETGLNYEILFVNDGSSDRSPEILASLAKKDSQVKVVNLSRNFGHQQALTAGIDHASGDAVILMDTDRQDSPTVIPQFIEKWNEGYDVVYAIRVNRKEGILKKAAFNIFHRLMRSTANIKIPLYAGIFSLMDRKVIDVIKGLKEYNRYLPGMRAWTGFRQTGIMVERKERYDDSPRVSLGRLFALALNGIFSFSIFPLRFFTVIGVFLSLLSMIGITIILYYKIFTDVTILGWSSVLISIFFSLGIQLTFLGVISEYLGRIYDEAKKRPLYIVDKTINIRTVSGTE